MTAPDTLSRIQARLDIVFELRDMPNRVLRKMATRRGIPAGLNRAGLMRAIYWDIVTTDDQLTNDP